MQELIRALEQQETNRLLKLVYQIIISRVLNLIDYRLLRPHQQLIVDLDRVEELLDKSRREDRPSTNTYQELIYQVIKSPNLSNLVVSILNREHRGGKGLSHRNNNVKLLNEDNLLNNKHQHRSSLEMSRKESQRHLKSIYIGRGV